ncbi:putative HSP20-like chaperone [Helianthus anomalus]
MMISKECCSIAVYDNQSWLRSLSPIISSVDFEVEMYPDDTRNLKLNIHGSEHDEPLCVSLEMEEETDDGMLLIQSKTSSDIKEEMKDGMLKLPNKDDIMSNIGANIIASFRQIATKRSWIYYDMFFDRSILGKELCPAIAMLSPINSFSISRGETYKDKVFGDSLYINMRMPGEVKMKLTTQGLLVSLRMHGRERGDVKTYFNNDTLFIEGKTKKRKYYDTVDGNDTNFYETNERHYIAGIHLPEGIHKKHNMIKREMIDDVLYVIIACCVKQDELHKIKDQLKKPNWWRGKSTHLKVL